LDILIVGSVPCHWRHDDPVKKFAPADLEQSNKLSHFLEVLQTMMQAGQF
jgi:hypothetical protein